VRRSEDRVAAGDALEGLERLSPRQESAIDEESRRCVYAKSTALLIVGPDRLAKLSRVEALVERLYVEPQIGRHLLQVVVSERPLILENLVVVLPELSLCVGAKSGFRGGLSLRMIGKGKIAINETNLVAVSAFNLLEGRTDPCAERSLKVGIFDDRHLRVPRTADTFVRCNRDRHARRR